jgi:hypothetical protein
MKRDTSSPVKPKLEECSICKHKFIVAEWVDGKAICLSCKVKRDLSVAK